MKRTFKFENRAKKRMKLRIAVFENDTLTKEEAEAILSTFPVDITFVDKVDTIKLFNKAEKRIFVRTNAVLGRKIQICHPPKGIL